MTHDDIAIAVLECVGGLDNVAGNSLCATRLRISVREMEHVNHNALHSINGVLGMAERGEHGIEVVFGPNLVRGVYEAFRSLTGPEQNADEASSHPVRRNGNFQVRITPETPGRPQVQNGVVHPTTAPAPVDNETGALLEMLED